MRSKLIALFTVALCLLVLPVVAQEAEEPTAEISWPPPVYLLRGEVSLRGTVNLPGMTTYFIEYRALDDDLGAPETRAWLPVTLPSPTPVVNDVLGAWDTGAVPDGLYELRLNVATDDDMSRQVVGPLRVENESMMADDMTMVMEKDMDEMEMMEETEEMEEMMPVSDGSPAVTARVNANVRSGDSTRFRIIGVLSNGASAPALGISSRGSGWFHIELSDGRLGWISPTVVNASGAVGDLQQVVPPALPPPPPPPPAVPGGDVDLVAGFVRHNSPNGVIVCGIGFQVEVDVANFGTTPSPGGRVRFLDYGLRDDGARRDDVAQEAIGEFPPIQPGQTVGATAWLTISRHVNSNHVIYAQVNFDNAIPERTLANNNTEMGLYKLDRGNC
ncbi:MAG: SH3 domain-containing protein [Anaerolineaceae bacterium]|nr:SH3 domain-containing protein [Anaerolineaceae bacterium]MDE0327589.1 SH3 domain-containing protein [Anaerolineaceae bacterium]